MKPRTSIRRTCHRSLAVLFQLATTGGLMAQSFDLDLELPGNAVSRRASLYSNINPHERKTYANLEGPGCIRHIWATHTNTSEPGPRNIVIRIFFDGEKIPYVEAPMADFFGVMHGQVWYPINTPYLAVLPDGGSNCYFRMPFAKSARVEFEAGDLDESVYCQVDWHQYPGAELKEHRRFCARWRREYPTQRDGENFLMFDADGPGQLLGFVYGIRLTDVQDRWSHGGSDNIYIDGNGESPSYIRGIGGEDVFGTSFGGSLHTPSTHLYASMPFYKHFDDGTAKPAKLLTGYRWFHEDSIKYQKSIHMRFGCMANDICSTVYWYQQHPVRPFYRLPPFKKLHPGLRTAPKILLGEYDLPLPDSGQWWISEVAETDSINVAARTPLKKSDQVDPNTWKKQRAKHGFVDFLHSRRPNPEKFGIYIHEGMASARCILDAPEDTTAKVRVAWDDRLVVRVGDARPMDLGHRDNFGDRVIELRLRKGENVVDLALSNTKNFNHGGWSFSFHATTPDGAALIPRAE